MLEFLPKPAVIAHRGASAYAPENTLAAFELAVQQQADAIELDVMLSADGQVIVFHDKTLNRTTDGSGLVCKQPLVALKELDAGSSFDVAFRGEQIPTLDEVFESVGKKTFINIELKANLRHSAKLVAAVVDCIEAHNLSSKVLISSFNAYALRQTVKRSPGSLTGLLVYSRLASVCTNKCLKGVIPHRSLHLPLRAVRRKLVDRIHRQGYKVFVYTVNQSEDMQRLSELGVDGIFTDDPLRAVRTIRKGTA